MIDIESLVTEPAPMVMQNVDSNIVSGVTKLKYLLIILHLEKLFSYDEIQKIEAL